MNPNLDPNTSTDPLDSLLAAHLAAPSEQLTPSSGFALSVMDAIHQQTAAPPAIAFPWRRALPGAVAIVCALPAFAAAILLAPATSPAAALAPQISVLHLPSLSTSAEVVMSSICLAALLSILTIVASFRLAGHR